MTSRYEDGREYIREGIARKESELAMITEDAARLVSRPRFVEHQYAAAVRVILKLRSVIEAERAILVAIDAVEKSDAIHGPAREAAQKAAFAAQHEERRLHEFNKKFEHALAMAEWLLVRGDPVNEEHLTTLRQGLAEPKAYYPSQLAAERAIERHQAIVKSKSKKAS